MTTDISDEGIESLIVKAMTGRVDLLSPPSRTVSSTA